MISISFTGEGIRTCSGGCSYCSAAKSMGYMMNVNKEKLLEDLKRVDDQSYEEFEADFVKVEQAFEKDPQFIREFKLPPEKRALHVDLWGGDPCTSLQCLEEMTLFLEDYCKRKEIKNLYLSTSTNGLPLIRKEVRDFLHNHKMTVQLSHDGLGQWIRTQEVDPMEWPEVQELIKDGTLNAINCTLSFWNNSFFGNIEYWNNYLKQIFPNIYNKTATKEEQAIFNKLYIKLNHTYNSDYDIKAKNKNGLYNGKVYEQLKGIEIGNWNLHNDKELAKKTGLQFLAHALDNYMNEYFHIAMLIIDPKQVNNPIYKPYRSYFEGQIDRWNTIRDHEQITGACRAYQRFKHKVGEERSWKSTTFVITTVGEYSECNLIESKASTLNPGGVQPDSCKGCPFEFQSECNSCGSMPFPNECEYAYRWASMLQYFYYIRQVISDVKQTEKMKVANRLVSLVTKDI